MGALVLDDGMPIITPSRRCPPIRTGYWLGTMKTTSLWNGAAPAIGVISTSTVGKTLLHVPIQIIVKIIMVRLVAEMPWKKVLTQEVCSRNRHHLGIDIITTRYKITTKLKMVDRHRA